MINKKIYSKQIETNPKFWNRKNVLDYYCATNYYE